MSDQTKTAMGLRALDPICLEPTNEHIAALRRCEVDPATGYRSGFCNCLECRNERLDPKWNGDIDTVRRLDEYGKDVRDQSPIPGSVGERLDEIQGEIIELESDNATSFYLFLAVVYGVGAVCGVAIGLLLAILTGI